MKIRPLHCDLRRRAGDPACLGSARWPTLRFSSMGMAPAQAMGVYEPVKFDAFVKSPKVPFSVIPVKTGIQSFQALLDSRLRGSDDCGDFLRIHQIWKTKKGGLLS